MNYVGRNLQTKNKYTKTTTITLISKIGKSVILITNQFGMQKLK